jgi:sulfur-oxidizing protein SoxZ
MVARVSVPATARRGEEIEVRIAIQHPMETGFRFDYNGKAIPKNVVNRMACRFEGEEVFAAELGSGIAANPFLQFTAIADRSGTFTFEWVDDNGVRGTHAAAITVTA